MKSSREQVHYALCRLGQIGEEKRTELRKKFTTEVEPPTLAEVIRKIKSGKFKLASHIDADRPLSSHHTVRNLFDLDLNNKVDHKGLADALKELEIQELRLRDKLMLGDCAEALKVLEDFSKS